MNNDPSTRLQSVAFGLRKEAHRRNKKPPTNEKGNIILTPKDITDIQKQKDWDARNRRPGGALRTRGGPHSDQYEKGHSRRDRKRTKQLLRQRRDLD